MTPTAATVEMPEKKTQTAFRLTPRAMKLLDQIAARLDAETGTGTRTAALELIIREAAQARGLIAGPRK